MRKYLVVFFSMLVAAILTRPLMSGLHYLIIPAECQLIMFSADEPLSAVSLFAVFFCACAGLAAAVGCYLQWYSVTARYLIVLLPMLITGCFVTLQKVDQFRKIQESAVILGLPAQCSLREASFYLVPATAFVAGAIAVTVAVLIRSKRSPSFIATTGTQAANVDGTNVT